FNFLPEGGFDDNQGSFSAKYVNNETPIIDAEPISTMLPTNVADNIVDSSNTSSDDELPPVQPPIFSPRVAGDALTPLDVDSDPNIHGKFEPMYGIVAHFTPPSWKQHLRDISIEQLCNIHDRAYIRQVFLDNILNSRTRELISALHKARESDDAIREREVKRDKAYDELEKKCNEALQDLDKNPLVSDMRSKIDTLQGQVNGIHNEYGRLLLAERKWANYEQTLSLIRAKEIDSLRQDKAAVLSKVVPETSMKLVHSDEMGVLVARIVRASIIHGRCMTFEEVAKLKDPFVLEKMPGYRTSSKDEYDRAGEDMANASYPFLSEFTSNPYAFMEQLLSIKP
ncbi:hypothetical protein Tco_0014664, partial [Tanacetum coccineum]